MPSPNPQQQTEIKRQIAYKCNIASLNAGVFVKKQGWESSYVMTEFGDFSRVNIIGVVVAKEDNALTLDDGTGQIAARIFNEPQKISSIDVGSLVLVIARPREFNNQIYLTLEIVKKISNTAWINYRKRELQLIKKVRSLDTLKTKPEHTEAVIVQSPSTVNSKERIINVIKQLDTGSGASIDDLMTISKVNNAEDIIQDMLLKGEVFEVKNGRIKLM